MENVRTLYFIKELIELQEKHGIQVSAGYHEEIDYDRDENPYVSGVNCFLVYTDIETEEEVYEYELPFKGDE